MVSRTRALLLALVFLMAPLAGCLSPKDAGGEEDLSADEDEPTQNFAENATLPNDRGESAGLQETNKTEEGVGGMDHKHDYWQGKDQIVVFDDTVYFSLLPVYPDGQGSEANSVAYIKIPAPFLVYEGARAVLVEVGAPTFFDSASPVPVELSMDYRTADSADFLDGGSIAPGMPVTIPVKERETDMPHSVSSLWAFKISTDRPGGLEDIPVKITVVRGADVVDWPGHPDFYADVDERVVFSDTVTVQRRGITEFALYGSGSSWVRPTKLISYGTGSVDVYVNVTSVSASNGAQPTGFFLEYHNATILDQEDDYNDRVDDEHGGRAFEDEYYHFVVPVEAAAMDGPYQPESRWGFRLVATFAETPVASFCPGCFDYDITFDMKIIAREGAEAARING